ncbi:Cacna1c [Symbiodinium sp. CCMP2592]|nr:Cacna1c [Symbiodinium sp. CCMP2592]
MSEESSGIGQWQQEDAVEPLQPSLPMKPGQQWTVGKDTEPPTADATSLTGDVWVLLLQLHREICSSTARHLDLKSSLAPADAAYHPSCEKANQAGSFAFSSTLADSSKEPGKREAGRGRLNGFESARAETSKQESGDVGSGDRSGCAWQRELLVANLCRKGRPSFTPKIFRTFDQFEHSLRAEAARADSFRRRRKFASMKEPGDVQPRAECCEWIRAAVRHPAFDLFFALVVVSNSIFIGVEVEQGLNSLGPQSMTIFVFQYAYSGLFTVELVLRLAADGCQFLCGPDWVWSWLDVFIVLSSLWEIIIEVIYVWYGDANAQEAAEHVSGIINLKAFRVIRITRIVKAVKLMRIFRFVIALRTLITSIIHTLQSLFWALALLVLIVYVFAVLFVGAVNDFKLDPDNPKLPTREMEASDLYFSSLPDTMLSLFMCIAGGVNWGEVQSPLKAISTVWVFFFLFYVAFTYFAVLNVVTGVFCQSAIDSAQNDHATVVQSILANKKAHVERIQALFSQFDDRETGVITFAMLEEKIDSPDVREYFETLGLDVWDAWTFFKLLDLDAGGAVETEEFLMGCLRLRGQARAIDVEKLIYDQTWLIKSQSHFQTYMEVELKQLKEHLVLLTGINFQRSSRCARFKGSASAVDNVDTAISE